MSAVSAIHEQHAETKQRIAVARDKAAAILSAHERTTKANEAQLDQVNASLVANATSKALGEEPSHDIPDARTLAELQAAVSVAEPVRQQLAINLGAADEALKAEVGKHKAAIADHLRETALKLARAELSQGFDDIRKKFANVIAAHRLVYHEFNDKRPSYSHADDVSGPAAQLLTLLRDLNWPDYPYDIRPDWLPKNGRFWSDEISGVSERIADLFAEVGPVPA